MVGYTCLARGERAAGARRGVPVLRRTDRGGDGGGPRRHGPHRPARLREGASVALQRAGRVRRLTRHRRHETPWVALCSPERWCEIERMFDAVLDRPMDERASFLERRLWHRARTRVPAKRAGGIAVVPKRVPSIRMTAIPRRRGCAAPLGMTSVGPPPGMTSVAAPTQFLSARRIAPNGAPPPGASTATAVRTWPAASATLLTSIAIVFVPTGVMRTR